MRKESVSYAKRSFLYRSIKGMEDGQWESDQEMPRLVPQNAQESIQKINGKVFNL